MKHRLAIAAIFKHENLYLREWIEYHRMVGVDHFYLYDNDGGEEALKILKQYREEGLVTPRHYREQCQWLMKIDIDEFLVPLEGDQLLPIIERYASNPRIRGIRIPRINFGHSGHTKKPAGLTIEAYTCRESAKSDHKDLARGEFLSNNDYSSSAHSWRYRLLKRGRTIGESKVADMRVNHYYTKSLEEYLARQSHNLHRGASEEDFFKQNETLNAISDDDMQRFVPELRARLGLEAGET